jgi:hypothetical protein
LIAAFATHANQRPGVRPNLPARQLLIYRRLMNEWILSSPQFQFLVVLFSTPFALSVAQYGMISPRDVQVLRASLTSYIRKSHADLPPGRKDNVADVGDVTRGAAVFKYVCGSL